MDARQANRPVRPQPANRRPVRSDSQLSVFSAMAGHSADRHAASCPTHRCQAYLLLQGNGAKKISANEQCPAIHRHSTSAANND